MFSNFLPLQKIQYTLKYYILASSENVNEKGRSTGRLMVMKMKMKRMNMTVRWTILLMIVAWIWMISVRWTLRRLLSKQ